MGQYKPPVEGGRAQVAGAVVLSIWNFDDDLLLVLVSPKQSQFQDSKGGGKELVSSLESG